MRQLSERLVDVQRRAAASESALATVHRASETATAVTRTAAAEVQDREPEAPQRLGHAAPPPFHPAVSRFPEQAAAPKRAAPEVTVTTPYPEQEPSDFPRPPAPQRRGHAAPPPMTRFHEQAAAPKLVTSEVTVTPYPEEPSDFPRPTEASLGGAIGAEPPALQAELPDQSAPPATEGCGHADGPSARPGTMRGQNSSSTTRTSFSEELKAKVKERAASRSKEEEALRGEDNDETRSAQYGGAQSRSQHCDQQGQGMLAEQQMRDRHHNRYEAEPLCSADGIRDPERPHLRPRPVELRTRQRPEGGRVGAGEGMVEESEARGRQQVQPLGVVHAELGARLPEAFGATLDAPVEAPDSSNAPAVEIRRPTRNLDSPAGPASPAPTRPQHNLRARVTRQIWLLKRCAEEHLGFEVGEGGIGPGLSGVEVQEVCAPALQHCLKVGLLRRVVTDTYTSLVPTRTKQPATLIVLLLL